MLLKKVAKATPQNEQETKAAVETQTPVILVGSAYDFLFEGENKHYDAEYKEYISPGFTLEDLLKQGHLCVAPIWNHTKKENTSRPIVIVDNDKANDPIGLIINYVTKHEARKKF